MSASLTYSETLPMARSMQAIVKEVGDEIMQVRGDTVHDQHVYKGHDSSSIDMFARDSMRRQIDRHFPNFEGNIRFELNPIHQVPLEGDGNGRIFHIFVDEIEGTTNTKRCLASLYKYRPKAMISMALATGESLADIVASAVYAIDHDRVLWAVKTDGHFIAFHGNEVIYPSDIAETRGDSKKRIVVAGYSNSHRMRKAELEQALWAAGFVIYDGCRASGIDIRDIIYNGFDAYVDLRSFWSTKNAAGEEKEAMLQTYDVAGMLPIALGSGLSVSDAEGGGLDKYGLADSNPLVVARPGIFDKIVAVTRKMASIWRPI